MRRRLLICTLVAGIFGWMVPVSAGDDDDHGYGPGPDHDRVRAAALEGRIRPLADILEVVRRDHPGEVIDVELEADHGPVVVYEVKIRAPDGRIIKVILDATAGTPWTAPRR
ncbi:MAG: PepSY domain-containing protein [Alphaproteobacteria bacterium]